MGASVGNKGFVAEINVTPFVDVMLVLLIIFMVTTPMLAEGLDIKLPKTEMVESLPTGPENVILSVRKDGEIYLNEFSTSMDTLAQQLKTVVSDTDKKLFLQADKEVPYGIAVAVMGKIKAAGIDVMIIMAEQPDDIPEAAVPSAKPGAPAAMPGTGAR